MKTEYKIITNIIEKNSRVLDVGCDNGTLMELLKIDKNDIKATLAINTFKEKVLKIPVKEINPSLLRIKLKIITLTIAEIELAIAKPRCPKPK